MKTIRADKISPSLLSLIGKGELVAVRKGPHLLAFVIPIPDAPGPRPHGLAKGQFTVPADFNEPDFRIEEHIDPVA